MKKSDLYREWARVLDMCDGTNVGPGYCWGYDELKNKNSSSPVFSKDIDKYFFAVAILENKPVFVGDNLYHKSGHVEKIHSAAIYNDITLLNYSWNPFPKETFNLNGVEMPCPTAENGKSKSRLVIHCEFDEIQYEVAFFDFDGNLDSYKVFGSIVKILLENSK